MAASPISSPAYTPTPPFRGIFTYLIPETPHFSPSVHREHPDSHPPTPRTAQRRQRTCTSTTQGAPPPCCTPNVYERVSGRSKATSSDHCPPRRGPTPSTTDDWSGGGRCPAPGEGAGGETPRRGDGKRGGPSAPSIETPLTFRVPPA